MFSITKARGSRGSKFATTDEGEELACAHIYWSTFRRSGSSYHDPKIKLTESQAVEMFASIKDKGRVILTDDEVTFNGGKYPLLTRKGYNGVFSIANPEFDERGLRFDIVKRLQSLA